MYPSMTEPTTNLFTTPTMTEVKEQQPQQPVPNSANASSKKNLPDVVLSSNKNKVQNSDQSQTTTPATPKDDTMLYVLESTNIPEDAVWSDYKHIQQIDKLPANIKIVGEILPVTGAGDDEKSSNETPDRPKITDIAIIDNLNDKFVESPDSTNVSNCKQVEQLSKKKMEQQSRCDTVIKSPDTTCLINPDFLPNDDGHQQRKTKQYSQVCFK